MEKLIYTLWKPAGIAADAFRDSLLGAVPALQESGASRIRVCVADSDVSAGAPLRQENSGTAVPDAVLTLWVDTAIRRNRQEAVFASKCAQYHCYLVLESEPLVSGRGTASGERTEGMNQIAFLQRPPRLTYEQWIETWQYRHTAIAIDIQATFGYRQNVVVRPLTADAPAWDAIVEENFPSAAMTSPHAFYDAVGDEALFQRRLKEMLESCARFIDADRIDVIITSEYLYDQASVDAVAAE